MYLPRRRSWFYRLVLILFWVYFVLVLYLVFFPISIPANWPDNLNKKDTILALKQINLVPFHYAGVLATTTQHRPFFTDSVANILLTIPAGLTLPYLAFLRPKYMLFVTLCAGFGFESLELAIKLLTGTFYHTVDINDVIMNTAGFLIGYGLFILIRWIFSFFSHHTEEKSRSQV